MAVAPSVAPTTSRPSRRTSVVAFYVVAAAAWIVISDILLARATEHMARLVAGTLKGLLFVAVTAAVLSVMIRRRDAALGELTRHLEATLDSIVDAVVVFAPDGRVVRANAAGRELMRAFVAPGKTLAELSLDRVLRGEIISGLELTARRAGRYVDVSVTASPVRRAPGGPIVGVVAVMRDVSELHRLGHVRDEFVSTAAHELKTPIAVIKAHAQRLLRRAGEPPDPAALAALDRQCTRIDRLVQELLALARTGGDDLAPHREVFDLGDAVADVVTQMERMGPHHVLVVRRPTTPIKVRADRERIRQIVLNLLDNAIKYSPSGSTIDTSVSADSDQAIVSVNDHGLGIPFEAQPRIFERYGRGHAGDPRDPGGFGIGLHVSAEVARQHGGRLWFESTPGSGSTFHLALPLATDSAEDDR